MHSNILKRKTVPVCGNSNYDLLLIILRPSVESFSTVRRRPTPERHAVGRSVSHLQTVAVLKICPPHEEWI
jgi:hypothetical protein